MMKRKKTLLMLGIILALLGGSALILGLMLKHEPSFYRRGEVPEGPDRTMLAAAFWSHAIELGKNFNIRETCDRPVEVTFSESQINSFLEENFNKWPDAAEYQTRGISSPRICIDKDRLRLGFRYTNSFISTVVSLDLHIWVVPNQNNLFAVEVLNRNVGAMPISAQSLQEEISALARSRKLDVTWYRHDGHPVALLRVSNSPSLSQAWVNRIDMQPGKLIIGVKPLDMPNAGKGKPLDMPKAGKGKWLPSPMTN